MTELVTGGRTADAREWNELMAGSGSLPNTLLSILGSRLKASFEEDLTQAMEPLGDEAFRSHFAMLLGSGSWPRPTVPSWRQSADLFTGLVPLQQDRP